MHGEFFPFFQHHTFTHVCGVHGTVARWRLIVPLVTWLFPPACTVPLCLAGRPEIYENLMKLNCYPVPVRPRPCLSV